jgi:hypothetical protein
MANKGSARGQPTTTVSTYMVQVTQAQAAQALGGLDEELTDLEDLMPPPKKTRRGITRMYVVANLAVPAWDGEDMYMEQLSRDNKYEPVTEPERGSSAHENKDDDPTPKKKEKVLKVLKELKVLMREAVKASHGEHDIHREQSKVSTPLMKGEDDTDQHVDCLIV